MENLFCLQNLIFAIVVILFVIFFIIRKLFFKRTVTKHTEKPLYSWFEILNPFNSAPIDSYKHLSPENKGAFWSVFSSIIVGVLTCWLGYSLQYMISNASKLESDRLVHIQIVEKLQDKYAAIYDSISLNVLENLSQVIFYEDKDIDNSVFTSSNIKLFEFLMNDSNRQSIVYTGKNIMDASADLIKYINNENSDSLMKNNTDIIVGIQMLEFENDTISIDSVIFYDRLTKILAKSYVKHIIPSSDKWPEICHKMYKYHKNIVSDSLTINQKRLIKFEVLTGFIVKPMLNNLKILNSSIRPNNLNIVNWYYIIFALFICIFAGYMIGRIVIMKFYDKKSMRPNPILSIYDRDKLNRKIKNYEEISRQKNVNELIFLNEVKSLKKDIEIINKLNSELQSKINNVEVDSETKQLEWNEKERKYTQEIEDFKQYVSLLQEEISTLKTNINLDLTEGSNTESADPTSEIS